MTKNRNRDRHQKLRLEKDVSVQKTFDHAISGARLILAKTKEPWTANAGYSYHPCYIVAWVAPWQSSIEFYKPFERKEDAAEWFAQACEKDPPVTPELRRDFQVKKVYLWEEKFIDRYNLNNMTLEQMERVVRRISDDFNMRAPGIEFKSPHPNHRTSSSLYYDSLHKILMKHKKLSYVFHEVAHAVDAKINGNKWSHHGPSYVRTLIMLAERYQIWHCAEELEAEAVKAGILVAPAKALPNL